ncbi:type II secretion system minor pseudopilin GspK [Sandaracinobacteroides saxicola]|nr:type II secretion system minor pseudopilin GspK [Sandaracinobacteroides saxicola]
MRSDERGAALFAVLGLVALLAGFAALGLSQLRAATDAGVAAEARGQARVLAQSAMLAARQQLAAQILATRRSPGRLFAPRAMALPEGGMTVQLGDGGNCFNLNSLAGDADRPEAAAFARLLGAIGVAEGEARRLAAATAAWASGTVLRADPSEWAAVAGVTPALYGRLAPMLCTLPDRQLAALNVNTLVPEAVPLLVAYGFAAEGAARAVAARPAQGYDSIVSFWQAATPNGMQPGGLAGSAAGLVTRWYRLDVTVRLRGETVRQVALLDSGVTPARTVSLSWSV